MYTFTDIEDFDSALLDSALSIAAMLSFGMAIVLLLKSFGTEYRTYARSCFLSGLAYIIFGVGYLLHVKYHFRIYTPVCYLAVCISYLHIGGVFLGLSHISILDPSYFKPWRVVRDILGILLSLAFLWWPWVRLNFFGLPMDESPLRAAGTWWHALSLIPFFLHCGYLALDIYINYYRVQKRASVESVPMIDHFVKWLLANCHFIVFVGISSAAVVLFWGEIPNAMTVLMAVATTGFCFMFKNIISFSYDIDSAYPTIEHVANSEEGYEHGNAN